LTAVGLFLLALLFEEDFGFLSVITDFPVFKHLARAAPAKTSILVGIIAYGNYDMILPSMQASYRVIFRVYQCLLLGWLCLNYHPVEAGPGFNQQLNNPAEVIAAVNALRQANGFAPYKTNSVLMAAAQAHSEYQAQIGSWTHSGSGGSTPRGRAIATGYGGGAAVYVTENVATGMNMTAQEAVQIWQGDSVHLNTMLSSQYQDAGAGVASDGDVVYITLDVGNVASSSAGELAAGPTSTAVPGGSPVQTPEATPAPGEVAQPIVVATPLEDGSIVHEVAAGQVLITIAEAYQISLQDLLTLNNMTTKTVIYPGEKLIIRLAQVTPTMTPTPLTETLFPTPTSAPTRTPTPTMTPLPESPLPSESASLDETGAGNAGSLNLRTVFTSDPLLVIIMVLIAAGIGLVVAGSILRRRT
jgi:LysM repeat protein